MYGKVKLDAADKIFSLYIREKANWHCEYCNKDCRNIGKLENSHFWSRRHEGTRFEPDNCAALCFYHHQYLGHGEGREKYVRWMKKRLGEARFKSLEVQAHTYCRKDRKLQLIIWKKALEDLKENL